MSLVAPFVYLGGVLLELLIHKFLQILGTTDCVWKKAKERDNVVRSQPWHLLVFKIMQVPLNNPTIITANFIVKSSP